ncbi:MAG: hypothetical protein ACREID_00830 [Planctomycetota bacterium]
MAFPGAAEGLGVILLGVETTALRWRSLPPLWVVVLLLVPLVLVGVGFLYRKEAAGVARRVRWALGALRALAVLLVLAALFGPYAETVQGEYFKRHLIVCIDTSRSMTFRDSYLNAEQAESVRAAAGLPDGATPAERTRLEIVKGVLTHDRKFLSDLADKFRLHAYTFAGDLAGLAEPRAEEKPSDAADRLAERLSGLSADGAVTRIGATIRDLVRVFSAKNEPVAGIVLFTDGRHTGGAPGPVEEARRAAEGTRDGVPIFPVAIGDPDAAINVGVSRVDAPEVVLAGDEVSFAVSVHARGYRGRRATLEAISLAPDGGPQETLAIDAEPFELPDKDDESVDVPFRCRFDRPGTYDLKIGVPPLPGEVVLGDNHQRHVVRVVRLKMRVLLVADRPSYDYRFLQEALFRAEETISANSLLLSAEADWPQQASRGEPILSSFPSEKSELAPFDVVILMDVDPRNPRFAPGGEAGRERVLDLIEGWVASGGGLVLEAGRDGNIPERYRNTKMMALLPVVPGNTSRLMRAAEETLDRDKRYRLTDAGRSHPILRILKNPAQAAEFWDGDGYATEFRWYVPVERAKSGAAALAVLRTPPGAPPEEATPLIAIQEYGAGKVLWLGTDDLWRMRRYVENLYYWPFWSGVVRHLATYRLLGGNKRIKIFLDRHDGRYRFGETVGVEAKFLDEDFEPVAPKEGDAASQTRMLKLRTPEGVEQEVSLLAVPEEPPRGIYRAKFPAGSPGTYRLYAEPERDEERPEATFVVEETTIEMRDPLMDGRTLEEIAAASHGKVLTPARFLDLLKDEIIAPGGIVRSGERRTRDLWDRAWLLYAFVGLLAVEWILRRRHLLL